ncbi:hypothetical protein Nmel_006340 [Mimus melanotis]
MDHQCLGALRDLGIPLCPSWQLQSHTPLPFPPADDSGDESVSQTDKTELQSTLRILSSKVEDLSTCNDLIAKHGTALQRSLSELEALRLPPESTEKIKQVNERATLFRITSNAMINACRDFMLLAQTHGKKWQKSLQQERDQRIRLEETLEQLAKQHNHLERAFRGATVLPAITPGTGGSSKGGEGQVLCPSIS